MAKTKTTTTKTSKKPPRKPAALRPIPDKVFFRIGEVARLLSVEPYVLRFWETEFSGLRPQMSVRKQRVYRRADVERLLEIRHLLYEEKYSIEGARRHLRTRGQPGLRTEKLARLRELADELGTLARTPIDRLFKS